MKKENRAKAEDILSENGLRITKDGATGEPIVWDATLVKVLSAMEAYAIREREQSVKKALNMAINKLEDSRSFSEQYYVEYSEGVQRGLKHALSIISAMYHEPAILSLLNNDKA